jgi:hypothetical protein
MIVTEFAVVTEVGNLCLVFLSEAVGLAGAVIDPSKHLLEGRAEIETAATTVANVGDSCELSI